MMTMDATRDFILCQIEESLEMNEVLDLSTLSHRIMLYNSLVALIVLPVEEMKKRGTKNEKNPLYEKSLSDIRKSCSFVLETFDPIHGFDKREGLLTFQRKTTYTFMRKLRNAIAHQNVLFDDDGFARISFFNWYSSKALSSDKVVNQINDRGLILNHNRVEDFRISMSFEELRDLSSWVGSEYLRALKYEPAV